MSCLVSSRFSISSPKFDPAFLKEQFPWAVDEASAYPATEKPDFHVTVFDLGIGEHDRVDLHLIAAKTTLLQQESKLEELAGEDGFALWVVYRFPAKEGAINVHRSVSAAFALLNIELIFHLKPE